MPAVLSAAGAGASGQQVKGVTAQYQLSGTDGTAENVPGTGVNPYDSGTILGQIPPGGVGFKLVSGVIQRSNTLQSDGTVAGGNCQNPTSGVGLTPTIPTGQTQADGLSNFPGRE